MGWLSTIFGGRDPGPAPAPPRPLKADGADLGNIPDPGFVELYDQPTLNREMVAHLYERNKLVARIIDTLPEDMTQLPLTIDAGMFNGPAISEAVDDIGGRMLACDTMILSRLYGGAGLLAFVEDGRPPHEPVDFFNITRIAGFVPMHRYELRVAEWDRRPDSRIAGTPNYGQPLMYRAQPIDGTTAQVNGRSISGLWHRTRVIPWTNVRTLTRERRLRYDGWSPGEIERIITELMARAGGMGHLDNLLRSFGFDVVKIAGLRQQLSAKDGQSQMQARLRQLSKSLQITSGGVRVVAIDAGGPGANNPGEDLTPMARPISGVRDLSDAQADHLQEVSDYPRSILYQRVNAGMGNGEALSERQSYYGRVSSRQPREYVPQMRQMIELICAAKSGPTGGIRPARLVVKCPSLWSTPEDVASETRLNNAQARDLDRKNRLVTLGEVRTDATLGAYKLDTSEDADLAELDYLTPEELEAALKVQVAQAGEEIDFAAARDLLRLGSPRLAESADALIPDLTDAAQLLGPDGALAPPKADIPGDLMKESDVRRLLLIGDKGLASYVDEGRLQPWTVRGRRKYSRADLLALLEAERTARAPTITADAQDLMAGLSWRMVRQSDETGVSGTGEVVRGLVLLDGSIISWWTVEGMPPRPHVDKSWSEFYTVHIEQHPTNGTLVQQWNEGKGAWVDVADISRGPQA